MGALLVGRGERVRIRLGNLSPMDHHSIHVHGLSFAVIATDGDYVLRLAQYPDTTVPVPAGSTRVIEMVPDEPGDWAMPGPAAVQQMSADGIDPDAKARR